jgi:hypothetical protein
MARTTYYYIWIEGISHRRGEFVEGLTDTGYDVTNKITESMRVKQEDLGAVIAYLKRHGVSDWVLDNPSSFVKTNYAPKGTLLDLKRVSI